MKEKAKKEELKPEVKALPQKGGLYSRDENGELVDPTEKAEMKPTPPEETKED